MSTYLVPREQLLLISARVVIPKNVDVNSFNKNTFENVKYFISLYKKEILALTNRIETLNQKSL